MPGGMLGYETPQLEGVVGPLGEIIESDEGHRSTVPKALQLTYPAVHPRRGVGHLPQGPDVVGSGATAAADDGYAHIKEAPTVVGDELRRLRVDHPAVPQLG